MKRTVNYKLIVQDNATCLDLLRYIDKNIVEVNSLGATVRVEKINKEDMDEDLVETFRKNGITRLPVLIGPANEKIVGLKGIVELFEKNINSVTNQRRLNPMSGGEAANAEFGTNPDLSDLYMRELFSGTKDGKYIPRKDKDEGEDDNLGEYYEKMMSKQRRAGPQHRRGDVEREEEPEPLTRRRRREPEPEDDYGDDNIADIDPPPTRRGRDERPFEPSGDVKGDDMDQRMLAAWMQNTEG